MPRQPFGEQPFGELLSGRRLARQLRSGQLGSWPARWLTISLIPAVAALAALAIGGFRFVLLPLLAVPPALAGIGAASPRRPLVCGAVMLLAAIIVIPFAAAPLRPAAAALAVLVVTAISAIGAERSQTETQKLADVTSVAEAAQRALLRPLPARLGPLEFGVVYLAAAAEARVGGDLYEVARTQFGIRLIVGDVRGKGLEAVEMAADVLGVFREVAHEVYTLAEVARRIDASLARRPAAPLEEFVTAVLAEIDPATGSVTIYNCGHPPPILLSHAGPEGGGPPQVTIVSVPSPALPLRLMSLGDCSGAGRRVLLPPGGALLLYTDGITEARDARREFYPLADRVACLAATADGSPAGLLDQLRGDLLRHVGAPLDDDAAMLLVQAPSRWDGPPPQSPPDSF